MLGVMAWCGFSYVGGDGRVQGPAMLGMMTGCSLLWELG